MKHSTGYRSMLRAMDFTQIERRDGALGGRGGGEKEEEEDEEDM